MAGHSKWANIKHRKARVDAQKGKLFTKYAREIMMAARQGGGDPNANFQLKLAIQKAREANLPNENIQRAIQKGSGGTEGANFEELVYEGYGPGGVAVLLELVTDNRNRTAGEIRHLFTKYGGNLGESGCVAWMFAPKGLVRIEAAAPLDEEALILAALEAGALDVNLEDETAAVVFTAPADLETVKASLLGTNYQVVAAEVTLVPQNTVEVTDQEQAGKVLKLLEALDDHDDVQGVYANFEVDDALMEQIV
ncbi:MAG: YebC/PmpR family DNA-binding transcriptional regulator [Heliobacteriaceae bacterium]|nr:YebC/PmpR family DNA-binding transcriptional regulator [Heliobacteriaceae bacterium]MDD4587097.1 YebC/PmpR family DNA-binding transcriptional regulator [Heliobacteriaceae bacterium]